MFYLHQMYVHACMIHAVPVRGQKRASDDADLELETVKSYCVGTGNPPGSSGGAASVLDLPEPSPSLRGRPWEKYSAFLTVVAAL